MRSSAGQSSIEIIALALLVLALAVVDVGVTVRDRIALADAAGRAARAEMRGQDAAAAARAGLPAAMKDSFEISVDGDELEASAEPTARLATLAGDVRLRTDVALASGGAR
jgi:hypothetical protein